MPKTPGEPAPESRTTVDSCPEEERGTIEFKLSGDGAAKTCFVVDGRHKISPTSENRDAFRALGLNRSRCTPSLFQLILLACYRRQFLGLNEMGRSDLRNIPGYQSSDLEKTLSRLPAREPRQTLPGKKQQVKSIFSYHPGNDDALLAFQTERSIILDQQGAVAYMRSVGVKAPLAVPDSAPRGDEVRVSAAGLEDPGAWQRRRIAELVDQSREHRGMLRTLYLIGLTSYPALNPLGHPTWIKLIEFNPELRVRVLAYSKEHLAKAQEALDFGVWGFTSPADLVQHVEAGQKRFDELFSKVVAIWPTEPNRLRMRTSACVHPWSGLAANLDEPDDPDGFVHVDVFWAGRDARLEAFATKRPEEFFVGGDPARGPLFEVPTHATRPLLRFEPGSPSYASARATVLYLWACGEDRSPARVG